MNANRRGQANLTLKHAVGDPKVRKQLNKLPLETFSSVLVLAGEQHDHNALAADSNSLATMLLVRDLQTERAASASERAANASAASVTTSLSALGGSLGGDRGGGRWSPDDPEPSFEPVAAEGDSTPAKSPQKRRSSVPGTGGGGAGATPGVRRKSITLDVCSPDGVPSEHAFTESAAKCTVRAGGPGPAHVRACPCYGPVHIRATRRAVAHTSRVFISFPFLPFPAHAQVVAEVLDGRTKELMSASLSDPVLSNDLVSMSLAMVAENRDVNAILSEIFSAEGTELYMRPSRAYVDHGAGAPR